MNRRRFVQSSVAGGLTLAVSPRALLGQAPTVMSSKSVKPVVIASANGNKFKNGGDVTCVQKAFTMMTQGGAGSGQRPRTWQPWGAGARRCQLAEDDAEGE